MRIRELTKKDIPAASAVIGKAIWPGGAVMAAKEWKLGRKLRLQKNWVVEEDGKIAGVIGILAHHTTPEHVCYLGWFSVLPGHQRQGVGRALLAHAEAYAKTQGVRILVVEAYQPSGEAGLAFYQKHGFTRRGVIPDYWVKGFDLVLMSKQLV